VSIVAYPDVSRCIYVSPYAGIMGGQIYGNQLIECWSTGMDMDAGGNAGVGKKWAW
jgi:hypothetical protein